MDTIAPPDPRRRHSSVGGSLPAARRLGVYTDDCGERREIVCLAGAGETMLVVDRTLGLGDARLVAHLAADEPVDNARSLCASQAQPTPTPQPP
jgi:hypothetical protein